jgi:hypothetical protein
MDKIPVKISFIGHQIRDNNISKNILTDNTSNEKNLLREKDKGLQS